ICLSASSLNSSVYLALGFLPICRFSLPNYTSARNPFFGGKVSLHQIGLAGTDCNRIELGLYAVTVVCAAAHIQDKCR
ncbi:hypothetical protein, partial [Caenimonas koreensis]|uniref:hypothetical protein n=1 Tax=Caenimonas koreensis TaxID=367474 RepID=UPI001E62D04A